MVGGLKTCSARVYRSSSEVSEAIFTRVFRSVQGRFTQWAIGRRFSPQIQIRLR